MPSFSIENNIDQVIDCLNSDGESALIEMMWVLKSSNKHLEFCPYLPQITAFLMMFCETEEVYMILDKMISESKRCLKEEEQFNRAEEMRGLRWYFTLTKQDFESLV